jgi:hypothetical protein
MANIYRIAEFLSDIDNLTGNAGNDSATVKKRINARCKAEIGYLRKHLELSSLRRARTDYRNAVKAHYEGKALPKPLTYQGSHIAVKYLVLTKKETQAYKQYEADRKDQYLTGKYRLIITNAQGMIDKANELLDSDSAYDLACGLLLATGRRPVEIFKTGNFEAIAANKVLFSGQAKTRNSEHAKDNYEIYTLANSSKVVNALAKLRRLKDLNSKTEREVNSLTSNALGKATKRNFNGYLQVTENGTLDALKPYTSVESRNLRPIYVVLSHKVFAPLAVPHDYALKALGHAHNDDSLNNYMEFMLHPSEVL